MPKSLSCIVCSLLFFLMVTNASATRDKASWSYEAVTLADGSTKMFFIWYDSFNEWLYFKGTDGQEGYFQAENVASFIYRNNTYYSLPFEDGTYSFFKVEFEGNNTALLSKSGSLQLMQYLARRYDKIYTLAEGVYEENDIQLCQINYAIAGFGPLSLNRLLPERAGNGKLLEKYLAPVYIKNCLFVVGEGGIEILQLNVDQDVLMGMYIKDKKYSFETLQEFFGKETYQKMNSYARKNRLKEEHLEDLKKIFRYYDSI